MEAHIAELTKKLSRAVGLLYKVRKFCPSQILRSLYFGIFNSHLSYLSFSVGICRSNICRKDKSPAKSYDEIFIDMITISTVSFNVAL